MCDCRAFSFRRWVAACLLLAIAPAMSARADDGDAGGVDAPALFGWFEGLRSFDSPGSKPWVRVYTGQWSASGDDPPVQTPRLGFLLEEKDDAFTVLFLDLGRGRFVRTAKGTAEHERVGYERLDPAKEIDAVLERLRAAKDDPDPWRRFGARTAEMTEVCVLAVAAHGQGLEEKARALCEAAAGLVPPDRSGAKPPLRQALAMDMAHACTWRLVVAFGGEPFSESTDLMPRKDLLAAFKDLAADFPESPHAERVANTVRILERMVAQDDAHAAAPARAWDTLSKDEQVAELVFQLRDQNGHQWSQPGWCDVFADPREGQSPAARLVALGFDAVPRLIAALDDDTFTRSVGFWRDFTFSHHVLRVADCAQAILSRIAGRNLWEPATTSSTMRSDGATPSVKQLAQAWWADVQQRGEEAVLAEGVRAGGRAALDQAASLLERFPGSAPAAIIEGIAKTEDEWSRVGLVDLLARVDPTEPVLAALRQELAKGPSLRVRLAAARALWQHGNQEGLDVALSAWAEAEDGAPSDPPEGDARGELVSFLVWSGKTRAMEALGHDLGTRPLHTRYLVVTCLSDHGPSSLMAMGPAATGGGASHAPEDGSDPWLRALEGVLAGRLEDLDRVEGMSGSWDGANFSDPRIGDLAAHILSRRFPERYEFDLGAGRAARDRARITALNTWRRVHDLEPLPLPERREVERTSKEVLGPLLAGASGVDAAARTDAFVRIRALGLAALPGLLEHSRTLDEGHAQRTSLLALACEIGARVVDVHVEGPAPNEGSALARAIAALANQPLGGERVAAVLRAAATELPAGSRGVRFECTREEDLTGVLVHVAFTPGEPERHINGPGWEHGVRVEVGRRALQGSHGSSSIDYLTQAEAWDDTREKVDEAVAMPPDRTLTVRITLTRTVPND